MERKHCANCNSWVPAKSTRCPNCLAVLLLAPETTSKTTQTISGGCPNCGGYKIEHKYADINLMLMLCSFSLWAIPYLMWRHTVGFKSWKCKICGYQWEEYVVPLTYSLYVTIQKRLKTLSAARPTNWIVRKG